MRDIVRRFIEVTAPWIDDDDWGKFFTYIMYYSIGNARDSTSFVMDVLEVLDNAGIDYQYYFKDYNLPKEDISHIFSDFREVVQPRRISGGPDGAGFITTLNFFPTYHTKEDVDKIAKLARDFRFKTYRTDNGGDGGYDYALISTRSTIEDFVNDLLWEVDGIRLEDFTLVE